MGFFQAIYILSNKLEIILSMFSIIGLKLRPVHFGAQICESILS